jgi:hypothetical protein
MHIDERIMCCGELLTATTLALATTVDERHHGRPRRPQGPGMEVRRLPWSWLVRQVLRGHQQEGNRRKGT